MTKNEEDTMYMIHQDVHKKGIRKKFDKQLKRMDKQDKHRYKTVIERWEYAYNKIK
jgi:hypothetical protein